MGFTSIACSVSFGSQHMMTAYLKKFVVANVPAPETVLPGPNETAIAPLEFRPFPSPNRVAVPLIGSANRLITLPPFDIVTIPVYLSGGAPRSAPFRSTDQLSGSADRA
jgi:hypothetical protein